MILDSASHDAPELIHDESLFKLWHHVPARGQQLLVRYSHVISFPPHACSASDFGVLEVLAETLTHLCRDLFFHAGNAGMDSQINFAVGSLTITAVGHIEQLHKLMRTISGMMKDFQVTQEQFEAAKTVRAREIHNRRYEPFDRINKCHDHLITHGIYVDEQVKQSVETMNWEFFMDRIPVLFHSGATDVLITGQATKSDVEDFRDVFSWQRESKRQDGFDRHEVVDLRQGINYVYEEPLADSENVNSYMSISFRTGNWDNLDSVASAQLISTILLEPLWNQLRTVEQLGYVVESTFLQRWPRKVHFLQITIQTSLPAAHITMRVDAMMLQFLALLEAMDDEVFQRHKLDLAASIQKRVSNVSEAAVKVLAVITDKSYQFDRDSRIVSFLHNIDKDRLLQYATQCLSPSSNKRTTISVLLSSQGKTSKVIGDSANASRLQSFDASELDGSRAQQTCVVDTLTGLKQEYSS